MPATLRLALAAAAAAAILAPSASGAPAAELIPRQAHSCAPFQELAAGPYTLQTNQWGAQAGRGSQCSTVDNVRGDALAWTTAWSWADNPNSVKSYTNVRPNSFQSRPWREYRGIPTTWSWRYTGTPIRANVAYDMFLGTCPTCNQDYEIMFWLCDYGVIYPLSDNGYPPKPAATPRINDVDWNLIVGHNGNMKVYTFVTRYADVPNFRGDLLNFLRYLRRDFGLSDGLYLQKTQAGTEAFTGCQTGPRCMLTTSAFTISVN